MQAKEITSFDKDRSEINLSEEQNTGRDKSISIVSIEAWIDNTNNQISIVGSGLKDTYILFISSMHQEMQWKYLLHTSEI